MISVCNWWPQTILTTIFDTEAEALSNKTSQEIALHPERSLDDDLDADAAQQSKSTVCSSSCGVHKINKHERGTGSDGAVLKTVLRVKMLPVPWLCSTLQAVRRGQGRTTVVEVLNI